MNQEIIIRPTFDIKSSLKGLAYILLKPKLLVVSFFVAFVFIFNFLDSTLNIFGIYDADSERQFPVGLVLIAILPFFFYFLSYRSIKKQLDSNPRYKEEILYILNNEFIEEKGDSFAVKHFWKNLYQIVEKKNMFLIFTLKNRAILIKKSDLKQNQYQELRKLFNSLDIKKKIK